MATNTDSDHDGEEQLSIDVALAALDDYSGDTYVRPETVRRILKGFQPALETELPPDHDAMANSELWVNRYLANVSMIANDARGVVSVPQYETILGISELSEQLADDLGVDPGDGKATGYARRSREQHEDTVANLADHFDVELPD